MTASTTVESFLGLCSLQLSDNNPQFVRWKSKELVGWINFGQRVIAKYMPYACARVDVIKLKAGTRQSIEAIAAADIKTTDGSTAPTILHGNMLLGISHNMGADGLTPGRAIRIVDRDVLDATNRDWHLPTKAGDFPTQYTYDPRVPKFFSVCPGVRAGADVWVEASLLADPIVLDPALDYSSGTNNQIVLSTDDKYNDDLLNAVLAQAYMKDAEAQGSADLVAAHSTMFANSINAQVKAMTGVNPNLKGLPLNGAIPAQAS